MWVWDHKVQDLASHPDIVLAPHTLLPDVGEERLRDKPKECLRGRLHRIGMNRFLRDLGSGFANLRGRGIKNCYTFGIRNKNVMGTKDWISNEKILCPLHRQCNEETHRLREFKFLFT